MMINICLIYITFFFRCNLDIGTVSEKREKTQLSFGCNSDVGIVTKKGKTIQLIFRCNLDIGTVVILYHLDSVNGISWRVLRARLAVRSTKTQ